MSANAERFELTKWEMAVNYDILGATPQAIQADLKFSKEEFDRALSVAPGFNPADVWKLRDYLERRIKEQGKKPISFTALTKKAHHPFGIRV